MSVSVLREALTKLAAEGVVTSEPHLGYAVTELSVDRLEELTDARLALECLVFARSVVQGDLQWESKIVAAHHVMEGTQYLADGTDAVTDEWAVAHAKFHDALLEGCANRRLFSMATALRNEAELYRRWSQPLGAERDRDLAAEHRGLLDAALARDGDRASALLADHISHTTRLLREASVHLHEESTA